MSNAALYGMGAGLQSFMQGAMDFAKLYMQFQQLDQEKQYRQRMLNLQQQELQQEERYKQGILDLQKQKLGLARENAAKQMEMEREKQDLLKGVLDKANRNEGLSIADKIILKANGIDVPTENYKLEKLGYRKDPRTGQYFSQIGVFRGGKLIRTEYVPVDFKPDVSGASANKAPQINYADKLIKVGKDQLSVARSLLASNPNISYVVNDINLDDPSTIVPAVTKLEEYIQAHPEDQNARQVLELFKSGLNNVITGTNVASQYSTEQLKQYGVNLPTSQPNNVGGSGSNYYDSLLK